MLDIGQHQLLMLLLMLQADLDHLRDVVVQIGLCDGTKPVHRGVNIVAEIAHFDDRGP